MTAVGQRRRTRGCAPLSTPRGADRDHHGGAVSIRDVSAEALCARFHKPFPRKRVSAGQDAFLVLRGKAAGSAARRDGALNEPDIRSRLVSSQDRVCELNYGQVTLQSLKAVMIHDRSQ